MAINREIGKASHRTEVRKLETGVSRSGGTYSAVDVRYRLVG